MYPVKDKDIILFLLFLKYKQQSKEKIKTVVITAVKILNLQLNVVYTLNSIH